MRHTPTEQSEKLSVADVLTSLIKAAPPSSILNPVSALASATYASTASLVFPCANYQMVTLLVTCTCNTNTASLGLRLDRSFKPLHTPVQEGSNPQYMENYPTLVDADFFVNYERTGMGTTPALTPDTAVIALQVGALQFTVTFPLRGANYMRCAYARTTGTGTIDIANIQAVLHNNTWLGWL